ncbi:MAG: energy transducer TonB [Acidobacteria bacterium]|nr:energy transducer TonB [Acidobacteriota bacterium]
MSGDKGRGPLPEGENYESVVLNFLDREMAAAQPADTNKDHSDDLDALVSDLLKQVISEADQTDTRPAAYDETESLLAEFPPVEVGPLDVKSPAETAADSHSDPATREAPETGPAALDAKGGMELATLEAESEMEMATLEAQSGKEFSDLETELGVNPEAFKANPEKELGALEAELEMEMAALEAQSEMEIVPPETASATAHAAAEKIPGSVPPGAPSRIGREPASMHTQATVAEPKPAAVKAEAVTAPAAADAKGAPALFAAAEKPKGKKPALAVAAACLLAVTGFGAYHFLSGPGEAPQSLSSAPAVTDPAAALQTPAATDPVVDRAETAGMKAQPAAARTNVAAAPVPIKAEAAPPVAVEAAVPAPPRDEHPDLIRGTDQIVDASSPSAIDSLIPSRAPGRSAPAAPRPPRPAPTQKAAAAAPKVSGVLIPAVPISQVTPKYPEIAVRTRTSAVVELDLVIDPNGRVIDATPVSGPAMFHKDAVDAVMKWRYRPASIGGANVQSQTRITMKFNLR